MNEQDFIDRLRKGDGHAFKEMVQTWQDMVYNTVLSIVQNSAEAEDITQDVFVRVFRSISSFRGESRLSTWLYRVAVTCSLDAERSRKRRTRGWLRMFTGGAGEEEAADGPFYHPGVQYESKEMAALLFRAMRKLPDTQRTAFVLVKTEGLRYEEVAAIMQLSVKAVEGLLHRAKENLRKELASYYKA